MVLTTHHCHPVGALLVIFPLACDRLACLLGGPSLCRDRRWWRTGLSNSDQLHFQSGASQRDPAIDPLPVSAPWRLFPGLSKSLHFRLYHNHSFLRPQFSSNSLSSSHTRTFCSFIRYSKMQLGMVNMQNRTVTSTNSTFLPFPKLKSSPRTIGVLFQPDIRTLLQPDLPSRGGTTSDMYLLVEDS